MRTFEDLGDGNDGVSGEISFSDAVTGLLAFALADVLRFLVLQLGAAILVGGSEVEQDSGLVEPGAAEATDVQKTLTTVQVPHGAAGSFAQGDVSEIG